MKSILSILIIQLTFVFSAATITDVAGFRMMSTSSPILVNYSIVGDLLDEVWTQGCGTAGSNGCDSGEGSPNVWMWDKSNQEWQTITNFSSGSFWWNYNGLLVYIFDDADYDGNTTDGTINLSVTSPNLAGSQGSGLGTNSADDWLLVGNYFGNTIDFDLTTKITGGGLDNMKRVIYVWNPATSEYKSWTSNDSDGDGSNNSGSGTLSNGLIPAYQSFWWQVNSNGYCRWTVDYDTDTGTTTSFLGREVNDNINDNNNNVGNLSFMASSSNDEDVSFLNFNSIGDFGEDKSDAYKLLPLQASPRLVAMSYIEDDAFEINNLPFSSLGSINIDFDIMSLDLNDSYEFVTIEEEVTLTWNLDNLPDDISIILTDLINNTSINLSDESEYSFLTEEKGSFLSYSHYDPALDIVHTLFNRDEQFNSYPRIGSSRFLLTVNYGSISGDINEDGLLNILDVVEIITLILINEYNEDADCNGDMELNVLDVVMIVDSILTN